MNTKVTIAGVEWNNPVTVASGTFGSGAEFTDFVDLNRLGAVTTKGVANVPWTGNPTPRVAETYGGMMNAVGLQNPGIDVFCERDIPFLKQFDNLKKIHLTDVPLGTHMIYMVYSKKNFITATVESFANFIVAHCLDLPPES